ncbi:unnamed protein product [Choristocarpus tenellus]
MCFVCFLFLLNLYVLWANTFSFSLPVRRYIFELFDQATPSSVDWEPYIDDTPRT